MQAPVLGGEHPHGPRDHDRPNRRWITIDEEWRTSILNRPA